MIRTKNQLRNAIKEKRGYLERYQSIVSTLQNEGEGSSPLIEKNQERCDKLSDEIEEIENKLENIGNTCAEETTRDAENTRLILDKEAEQQSLKHQKAVSDKTRKETTYQKHRLENKNRRWDRKKYGIYYRKLLQADDTLPSYIRANLAEMPNNKGYIWRGVHYYGRKPPEKNEAVIMFEKYKGKLIIHKSFDTEWQVLEKGRDGTTKIVKRGNKKKFSPPKDWPKPQYTSKRRYNKQKKKPANLASCKNDRGNSFDSGGRDREKDKRRKRRTKKK